MGTYQVESNAGALLFPVGRFHRWGPGMETGWGILLPEARLTSHGLMNQLQTSRADHEKAPASGTCLPGWTEGAFLSSPLLAESGNSWVHVADHVSDHVVNVADHGDGDVITRLESNAGEVSARRACL